MAEPSPILVHYGQGGLRARLEAALQAAGLGEGIVTPQDLAPLDQFHTRGLAATVELAAALAIQPGTQVIDVGSGLGGPSRTLAMQYDCQVQGIDFSPGFVEAARYLAGRAGLADRVTYRCADALALPFAEASFDLAWTQHVAMNIADRDRMYGEIHRVLRPGGRLAIYDVVAGPAGPPHFPVPWSPGPDTSFLLAPDAMRAVLERQGFAVAAWEDRTAQGVAWFDAQAARAAASPPALGLHLAMGPGFPAMSANLARNLREGRVGLVQAILTRTDRDR